MKKKTETLNINIISISRLTSIKHDENSMYCEVELRIDELRIAYKYKRASRASIKSISENKQIRKRHDSIRLDSQLTRKWRKKEADGKRRRKKEANKRN